MARKKVQNIIGESRRGPRDPEKEREKKARYDQKRDKEAKKAQVRAYYAFHKVAILQKKKMKRQQASEEED